MTLFDFLIDTLLRKTPYIIIIMFRLLGACIKPFHSIKPFNSIKPTHIESRVRKVIQGSNPGHLYIIKEREFIKSNENIYKIGKTKNIKYSENNYMIRKPNIGK